MAAKTVKLDQAKKSVTVQGLLRPLVRGYFCISSPQVFKFAGTGLLWHPSAVSLRADLLSQFVSLVVESVELPHTTPLAQELV